MKTHEQSAANAPQEQWRLHLLLLAAIEFAKLGSSEREAAKKAHALLKECEKLLQEEGTTVSKPVSAKTKRQRILLNAGPIPPDRAFKEYFGDKYIPWKEGIVAITGENKADRAEEKIRLFLKSRVPEGNLEDILKNLRENGFPQGEVESYHELFPGWLRKDKSKKSSESGKKSSLSRKTKRVSPKR